MKELHLLSQAPLPEVPPALLGQARRLGGRPERLSGPAARWKMAAAFGVVGVALMLGLWLEGPRGSEPSITAEGFRTVRGEDPGDRVPALVFPEPDAVLDGQDLRLEWSRVAGAVSYEVVLLNAEGGLVESVSAGDSPSATLRSLLQPGVYFVSVSADLPEGRTVKSGFSRFTIEVPR